MGLVRLFPPLSRQPSLATRGVKEPEYEVAELDGWPTGYIYSRDHMINILILKLFLFFIIFIFGNFPMKF